jgi:hypothetical protein
VGVAELLAANPAGGKTFVPLAGITTPRRDHAALVLGSGDRVIIIGGRNDGGVLGDSVLYQAATRTLTAGPITLKRPRYDFAAFIVADDLVVAGGTDAAGALIDTAEIYGATDLKPKALDVRCYKRAGAASIVMPNQMVLVLGGTEDGNKASLVDESYQPLR